MRKKILLPADIEDRLHKLTGLPYDAKGALLYRKVSDTLPEYCAIDACMLLGIGEIGNIRIHKDKKAAVDEFLKENQDYRSIELHVNSDISIRKRGCHYMENLSDSEMNLINIKVAEDEEHISMLVTPDRRILYGADKPILLIQNFIDSYEENNSILRDSFSKIENEKGYGYRMI